MKNFLKVIIIVAIVGILAACMNTNNDGNQPKDNEQNKQNNERTEEKFDQDDPDKQREYNRNKNGNHHKEPHERRKRNPNDSRSSNEYNQEDIVLENDAFKIFEPAPKSNVKKKIVVSGIASVPEGKIHYILENCHSVLEEGTTTASKSAPDWGEFEFTIEPGKPKNCSAKIILSEDGSKTNELIIPVHLNK